MKRYIKASDALDYNKLFSLDATDTRSCVASITDNLELLELLAYDPDNKVRREVAANPNTPVDIILEYLAEPLTYYNVKEAAIANLLSYKDSIDMMQKVFNSPTYLRYGTALFTYSPEVLDLFSSDPDPDVRRLVAGSRYTEESTLLKLVSDSNTYVRSRIAGRDDVSVQFLNILSDDADLYVRGNVADNVNTPDDILEKLSNDSCCTVRESVADNPHVSESILKKLCNDDSSFVRETAIAALNSRGINI